MISQETASLLFRAYGDTEDARKAFKQLHNEIEKSSDVDMSKTTGGLDRVDSRLTKIGSKMQSFGGGLQSLGATLTGALTVPLTGLAALGIKSSLELDKARTKMIALTGSKEAATKKWAELNKIADESVGVFRASARETFNQLKGLRVSDEAINKLIPSLGKLNAAFNIEDQQGFTQNLNQIFKQGFERTDIKEAIGHVPIFEELLENAFGTSDGAKLKALKDSGQLTLDQFLSGISDSINSDSRVSNVQENLSTKLGKGWERLNESLAPIGDVILQTIVPAFEAIVPLVTSAAQTFSSFSPAVQTVIVVIGAIIAAIGPLLAILGTVIVAVGGFVAAWGAIGGLAVVGPVILGVLAVVAQVGAVLALAGAAAYALYQAWQSNFGGIRDFTNEVWSGIQSFLIAAMGKILVFVSSTLADIRAFWKQNGADIKAAAQKVYSAIATVVKGYLDTIRNFWKTNGTQIKAIVSAAWDIISAVIKHGVSVIANLIKLVAAVIRGDWGKAWEAAKAILKSTVSAIGSILSGLWKIVKNVFSIILNNIIATATAIGNAAIGIGKAIISGIINGIGSGASMIANAITSMASKAISTAEAVLGIESPSKVFYQIGLNLAKGLANGIWAAERLVSDAVDSVLIAAINRLTKPAKVTAVEAMTAKLNSLRDVLLEIGVIKPPTLFEKLQAMFSDASLAKHIAAMAESLGITVKKFKEFALLSTDGGLLRALDAIGALTGRAPGGQGIPGHERNPDGTGIGDGTEVPDLEDLPLPPELEEPSFLERITEQITNAREQFKGFGSIVKNVSDLAFTALDSLADKVGDLVGQWVLYGKTGTGVLKQLANAMRQAVAQRLAAIASEAAIQALYATALGFLRLAQWDFGGAASAFLSAGQFAAIAGATAIAGRAVAGNSFQQESQGAFGSSSSHVASATQTGSDGPNVLTENRIQRQEIVHVVEVRSRDSHITEVVRNDIEDRGGLHGLVVKVAEQT